MNSVHSNAAKQHSIAATSRRLSRPQKRRGNRGFTDGDGGRRTQRALYVRLEKLPVKTLRERIASKIAWLEVAERALENRKG